MTVTCTQALRLGALALALAFPATATPLQAPELSEVTWRGKSVAVDDLSSHLSTKDHAAVEDLLARYAEWVSHNDYHVALSEDARVILITKSAKASKRRMKLVEKTLVAFDALMSPPDRGDLNEEFTDAEWGVGDHVPDAEPVVLIEIAKEAQYLALLAGIGSQTPTLEGWARSQSGNPGFAEEQVSTAAWQVAPDGYEIGKVWRSENELVNRLARLMIHRSFGPQPTWLRVAGSWRVEMDVMKSMYCFPYRQGFVGVGDHSGWEPDLKRQFKKRKKSPLEFDEIGSWKRNTWSDDQAHLAWGFVEFLARHKPDALPGIAEEFRKRYKAGYRTTFPDGTWTTDPSFEVPVADQLEVIREGAGGEVMGDTSEFFRSWKRYKPQKKR